MFSRRDSGCLKDGSRNAWCKRRFMGLPRSLNNSGRRARAKTREFASNNSSISDPSRLSSDRSAWLSRPSLFFSINTFRRSCFYGERRLRYTAVVLLSGTAVVNSCSASCCCSFGGSCRAAANTTFNACLF